jgi:hypothetical protein
MNSESIQQLQRALRARGLNVPISGVLDQATFSAMNSAVASSVASNPRIAQVVGSSSPDALVNAYMTNNWSGVTDITGKPFSATDQKTAVAQAEKALAPGYKAQESYDTANVADTLSGQQDAFGNFLSSEAKDFTENKNKQDQNAADQGVLFSGARYQKLNDLKNTYEDRQNQQRNAVGRNITSTARDYQYRYGNPGADKLSSYYQLDQGNTYNPQAVRGGAAPSNTLSSTYDPSKYKFQGTAVNANKAATQVRAASLLSNKANKLSMGGYKTQY